MSRVLVEVKHLSKYFHLRRGQVLRAVHDVSFAIREGETFGLVGESGSGKSTVGRTVLRLYDRTAGEVLFDGRDVFALRGRDLLRYRREAQMIFQDPYASLNPRMMVMDIVAEGIDIHRLANTPAERRDRVYALLEAVGLTREHAFRFPHEFSGGQRQRIGIARALAVEPRFIVADEPISALDVSIQAQIVNLLYRLKEERGLTYLFIAHDLSMVRYLSDRIGVMYLGHLVEVAPSDELYRNPLHPYTRALLSAIPVPDPRVERTRERIVLSGEIPSPLHPPSGCPFRTRCPLAQPRCAEEPPPLREVAPGHFVACHFV
ncbi:ABC transporter ATP-binding protein [Brockia lithotrophica]|uniref:Oligopeptide transport system ATP-binding protein n=1 Tax=Brockia lithotrophica TaxID=933949 RepID=A0A660LBX3_9BACL|nr:ABC transporter ATP-binding protein [Brockia lithotrophica]RKQ89120.1 oligopeptide transport system ATP-binding protein [Brockia lithotrophica]